MSAMNTNNSDPPFSFNSFASTSDRHKHSRRKRLKSIRVADEGKLIRVGNEDSVMASSSVDIVKPRCARRPDPAAPKITEPCSECGKKFWSLKALFGHMRCHPERQWRGINPPPNFRRPGFSDATVSGFERELTEEDNEIADCLIMLANGQNATGQTQACNPSSTCCEGIDHQESGAFFMDDHGTGPSCRFECSSCKKVFGSHQALGGHRASHKNVKGCFAITRSESDTEDEHNCGVLGEHEKDSNMEVILGSGHKCSICLRVFPSGQALGGHMRRHWDKADEPSSSGLANSSERNKDQAGLFNLDLNLPAPGEDKLFSPYSSSSALTLDLRLGL